MNFNYDAEHYIEMNNRLKNKQKHIKLIAVPSVVTDLMKTSKYMSKNQTWKA